MFTSEEIRQKFIKFFEERGHKNLPSSSLVPEGDLSVLFTTAGMQQFKPYYTAPENALRDFGSKNIVTVQKCIRTGDIDEVGDATHLTFFEMLGNFSFGGYGRKEAITYAYQFITKELGLEISYVTFYKGEGSVPRDEESRKIWLELGIPEEKIKEDGSDVFWGPTGDSGPCGPTTEIYCKNADGLDVEIWNIVFNEYFCDGSREKLDKGEATLKKLGVLGVDTGMGLERLLTILNKKQNVYETDVFSDLISILKKNAENYKEKNARIIVDHIKASVFISSDGVSPSSTGRGYVLRRLIRRVASHSRNIGAYGLQGTIRDVVIDMYPQLKTKISTISSVLTNEIAKFSETLERGLKEFEKGEHDPFVLATTYGFPIELTEELAKEKNIKIDREEFNKKMSEHQKLSQTSSLGMFKGGLANHEPATIKLHTAHHLLLEALQQVLGKEVKQKGSNINEERLRIDFSFDRKMTDEEKKKVEDIVNENIKKDLKVVRREMPREEAEKIGAEMEFGAKYPDMVSVYFIEDGEGHAVSKEFCGGPHVSSTKELGHFKILKEEASSAGVRRIKAILE